MGFAPQNIKVLANHVNGATLPTCANRKLLGVLSTMSLSIHEHKQQEKSWNKSIYFHKRMRRHTKLGNMDTSRSIQQLHADCCMASSLKKYPSNSTGVRCIAVQRIQEPPTYYCVESYSININLTSTNLNEKINTNGLHSIFKHCLWATASELNIY